ncbi:MAG: nucleotidyl transferase AbiEii/AbiGii toxin family protein [Candidatus Caldatribacteriota bacterium]|nr:nucleotidyl transferase AbiEii/AbiGii toxin family protein [Candidatus Caldatribacteriota bacterium]
MINEVRNIDASIKARLKNIAKQNRKSFNLILQLYMQERLLYRLSISDYKDNFVLKGGLFLFSMTRFTGRPTRDIDFLAYQISNEMKNIKEIFRKICKIEYNDGIIFDSNSVSVEEIRKELEYKGLRVRLTGYLGKAKEILWLDIGFNDIVVPEVITADYPVLLDMDYPKIKMYSFESVIAEKFEAIVSLGELNSRMKDFYDIFVLLSEKKFDRDVLQRAIVETFKRRGTDIQKSGQVFKKEFIEDNNRINQWKLFLKKIGQKDIKFGYVMSVINKLPLPIYNKIDEK